MLMALAMFEVFENAGDGVGLGHFTNDMKLPTASGKGGQVDRGWRFSC